MAEVETQFLHRRRAMPLKITKRDAAWSYLAQTLAIGSGLVVLPFVLRKLPAAEIGLNYLMLTLSALVSLFDFGFSPQFGRNFAYVFSGAQSLLKEGVDNASTPGSVNYNLLAGLIQTARFVYRRLSAFAFFFLIFLGTIYLYYATGHFTSTRHIPAIWTVFSLSVYFSIYFSYYNAMLVGRGLIKESQKASIASRLLDVSLAIGLIYCGWGLMGLTLAHLISPFAGRAIAHRYFYTAELKEHLRTCSLRQDQVRALFRILWHNSQKLGLVSLAGYAVSRGGIFLAGLFLTLEEVGSYGLMMQLMGIVAAISGTLVSIQAPVFASHRVQNQRAALIRKFAFAMVVFYFLFGMGTLVLVFAAPALLPLIKSNVVLPGTGLLALYGIVTFLEQNHSHFATFIASDNSIPFTRAALFSGVATLIGLLGVLSFTATGILGLVFVPGVVQLCYNNWKWPHMALRDFNINFRAFFSLGVDESRIKIRNNLARARKSFG
jgi:O-antigen/teichoic acid export membrane protein